MTSNYTLKISTGMSSVALTIEGGKTFARRVAVAKVAISLLRFAFPHIEIEEVKSWSDPAPSE